MDVVEESISSLSLKRVHDSRYHSDKSPEWLPRRASFSVRIGPELDMATRVWRELHIELSTGPEFLYSYFPFCCAVYVDGQAATILEFNEASERQVATVRVPVGKSFDLTIISELSAVPAEHGQGGDTRELALLFFGCSVGPIAKPVVSAAPVYVPGLELEITSTDASAPEPVFVVGSYRSGTSVLTWAIGQHPNIWPIEESGWLPLLGSGALAGFRNASSAARSFFTVYDFSCSDYMAQIGRSIDELMHRVSKRHLHRILLARVANKADEYNKEFQLARSAMNPKRRWVDGTPENSGYILTLLQLFPKARFVALVRDPLDVIASMLFFDRAGGLKRDVRQAAEIWKNLTRWTLLAYRAYGPSVVHLVSHAQLIKYPQSTLSGIFEFLGEPDFPKSAETFSKRINSSKVEKGEREQIYAEIDAEPEIKAVVHSLYNEALDLMNSAWEPDEAASLELRDELNNELTRMISVYRGD